MLEELKEEVFKANLELPKKGLVLKRTSGFNLAIFFNINII